MNFQSATSVSNTEAVELLYKNSLLSLAAPFHGTFTLTAGSTLGMRVFLQDLGGGGLNQFTLTVNNTTSLQFWSNTIVLNPSINSIAIFNIPIAANAGDVITVQLSSNVSVNVIFTLTAIGSAADVLASPASPISDFPVGGLLTSRVTSVVGNVQILPTPPLNMAYRLHSVCSFNAGFRCFLIDGPGNTYGTMSAVGTGNDGTVMLNGNLSVAALFINSGNAGLSCTLQYDLIALPEIL